LRRPSREKGRGGKIVEANVDFCVQKYVNVNYYSGVNGEVAGEDGHW